MRLHPGLAVAALALASCGSGAPSSEPAPAGEDLARLGDVIGDVDGQACDPTASGAPCPSGVTPETTVVPDADPTSGGPTSTVAARGEHGGTGNSNGTREQGDQGDQAGQGTYEDRFLPGGSTGSGGTTPATPQSSTTTPVAPPGGAPPATSTTTTTVTFPPPPVP